MLTTNYNNHYKYPVTFYFIWPVPNEMGLVIKWWNNLPFYCEFSYTPITNRIAGKLYCMALTYFSEESTHQ